MHCSFQSINYTSYCNGWIHYYGHYPLFETIRQLQFFTSNSWRLWANQLVHELSNCTSSFCNFNGLVSRKIERKRRWSPKMISLVAGLTVTWLQHPAPILGIIFKSGKNWIFPELNIYPDIFLVSEIVKWFSHIWVNLNISLTILRPILGWFPLKKTFQWGRTVRLYKFTQTHPIGSMVLVYMLT